jgi:asparagine synthase (glutamine-hydrolysing)
VVPDDEGGCSEGCIGFGRRWLAILDLGESGGQSMGSSCARHVLGYNGYICNCLDLREVTEKEGAAPQWRGQPDPESLVAEIAHWWLEDTLCRPHGMFAVPLWGTAETRTRLARDRMKGKTSYWGWLGKGLAFASVLKAKRAEHSLL